jgi:hypothetical protein
MKLQNLLEADLPLPLNFLLTRMNKYRDMAKAYELILKMGKGFQTLPQRELGLDSEYSH